ncbi:MAG TPA: diguanylate cyclase [Rugosibacter sp.]|nr:diguanylate cyclase [Rugosibacter sp.]HQQ35945.1 diguanylate cyclase [Rugosibacter sp.]
MNPNLFLKVSLRGVISYLTITGAYAFLVSFSFVNLPMSNEGATLYLASGISLAALLLKPHYGWSIFLGALIAFINIGLSLPSVIFISLGATLSAYLGAFLLLRNKTFDAGISSVKDYLLLISCGALVTCTLSAAFGVTGLLLDTIQHHKMQGGDYWYWWLSDVLGVVLLTPLILIWTKSQNLSAFLKKQPMIQIALSFGFAFLIGQIIFADLFGSVLGYSLSIFFLWLPVLWVAVRFGKHWVVLLVLMFAMQALMGDLRLFGNELSNREAIMYWLFFISLAVLGMLLSIYYPHTKKVLARQRYENEMLQYRQQILQQVTQGDELEKILKDLTAGLERIYPDSWSAILMLDRAKQHLIYGAASRLPESFRQATYLLPLGEGVGACSAAVKRGEAVIIPDLDKYVFWPIGFKLRDVAKKTGIRSWWSQPIKNRENKILGTLDMYFPNTCAPSLEESLKIEQQADFVAHVLDMVKQRKMQNLKSLAFNAAANAMVITDDSICIEWANPAFSEMTGYPLDQIVGTALSELGKSDKQDVAYYESIWKSILSGNVWQGELICRNKEGADYDQEMTVTPIKDEEGVVRNFVAVMRNISERKKAEDQIRNLAFYDTLTQLPNRRLFDDRLNRAMVSSKRSNRYGALMFLDLDNFKPLNDKYGHGTGDLLLVEVAQRITRCVRGTDTVARFGGDEFVVMLDGLDADRNESISEAEVVAEKIRRTLAEPFGLNVFKEGRGDVRVEHRCSTSIGVALFIGDGVSCDDLLKRADMAMYRAKDKGRNRVHFFDVRHV